MGNTTVGEDHPLGSTEHDDVERDVGPPAATSPSLYHFPSFCFPRLMNNFVLSINL